MPGSGRGPGGARASGSLLFCSAAGSLMGLAAAAGLELQHPSSDSPGRDRDPNLAWLTQELT